MYKNSEISTIESFVDSPKITLPRIPWEDKTVGYSKLMWRYSENPIIDSESVPTANSIFNSAVISYKNEFRGVFRCDDESRRMRIHCGWSNDGIKWKIDDKPINFVCENSEIRITEAYDPRVCWVEDRYYISWCNVYNGPTIGLGYTYDFEKFYQIENAFLPFNRNGVLFPRKINGKYAMLSRPSDNGHTPFGDIYYSTSPDMYHWGYHRHVASPSNEGWDSTKIGAGPVPIETPDGWLLIYHGVLTSPSGLVYHAGAMLLDIDRPWKVLYRSRNYILSPKEIYERIGDVPNVVFPCAALYDNSTRKLAIYYGAADTVIGLAFCYIDELIDFVKLNSEK